jgi:hypothetical protein
MRVVARITLLAGLFLGMVISMAGQNSSSKRRSATGHRQPHHNHSSAPLPNESKQIDANLTKLENKGARPPRPAHRAPQKVFVPSSKTAQDRQHNPPINFGSNRATKNPSTNRSSGSSRASGTPHMGSLR